MEEVTQLFLDTALFDDLTAQAMASLKLRINYDLRNSPADQSQRMLNALEPGTIIPIHRHCYSSETVVVLKGKVRWFYYNGKGDIVNTFFVSPSSNCVGLSIPKGQWHSLECLESGTVIFETKDGPYTPMETKDMIIK